MNSERPQAWHTIFDPINRVMTWIGRQERTVLIVFALICGGIWTTVETIDFVLEGESQALDETLLLSLRNPADTNDPIGPLWVEEMVRDITGLGGTALLTIIIGSVVGMLYMQGNYRQAHIILLSILGAMLLSYVFKDIFDRPRPDLVAHGSNVRTASFPSGHSLLAASTYLTLGTLLAQVQERFRIRAFIICLSILIVLLVGFSRVYLGVHWPSDVLAGWTIGFVWALFCWLASWKLFPEVEILQQSNTVAEAKN